MSTGQFFAYPLIAALFLALVVVAPIARRAREIRTTRSLRRSERRIDTYQRVYARFIALGYEAADAAAEAWKAVGRMMGAAR